MTERPDGGAILELLRRRWSRREVLAGGGALAAAGLVGCDSGESRPVSPVPPNPGVFTAIAGSAEDRVIVPDGFVADVLMRWGDPVVPGSAALAIDGIATGSLLQPGAAAAQAQCFGTNCDGLGIFRISDDRIAICVNHELPEPGRMFAGWTAAGRERQTAEFVQQNPELVAVMRASVGLSVLEFERAGESWRFVADSPLNRRITADTPIEMAGPAARHPWLGGSETEVGRCLGTFGNCAANETPWGTYLTAEENTNDFFGNADGADWDPLLERANDRFGMRRGVSLFRWELVDERFDHAKHPTESMKFGWIVELDPMNPGRPIRKRTALGKLRHEGAMTVLDGARRPVVYMGDDAGFEYFYKFVGDRSYDPASPEGTDTLLDSGTLYVAKLNDDGSGEWLPLVHGSRPELGESNGFSSQADVVMRCREAADLVGATPLDRPEDVAVHPHNGRVYLACTQGTQRGQRRPPPPPPPPAAAGAAPPAGDGAAPAAAPAQADSPAATAGPEQTAGTAPAAAPAQTPGAAPPAGTPQAEAEAPAFPAPDAANPRGPNPYGHILEFSEAGSDAGAREFRWEVFILAGDPGEEGLAAVAIAGRLGPAVAYYAGRSDSQGLSAFANPDNLGFDPAGNLWIVTDGTQPDDNNNGCFVCPTEGPDRGLVRQFMSGPVGAEIAGATFAPDGQSLFLSVQHPGSGSSIEEPNSHWPDGGDSQPRSSLIAVRSIDPLRRFYA